MVSNTTEQDREERFNLYWWLTNLFQHKLEMDEWDLDMNGLKRTEQDREDRFNLYWWLTILFQHQLKMDEWDLDMDGLKTTEQDREERFNLYLVFDKLVSGPVEDG